MFDKFNRKNVCLVLWRGVETGHKLVSGGVFIEDQPAMNCLGIIHAALSINTHS